MVGGVVEAVAPCPSEVLPNMALFARHLQLHGVYDYLGNSLDLLESTSTAEQFDRLHIGKLIAINVYE